MGWLSFVVLFYGIANLVMGVQAYFFSSVNHPSIMSLIGGGGCGIVLIVMAALSKTNPKVAFSVSSVVAMALVGMFAKKALVDHILYPATVSVVLGVATLICLLVGHFLASKA